MKNIISKHSTAVDGAVKLKKDVVYEGQENEQVVAVKGTWSVKDKVDQAMMNINLGNQSHIKYISLKKRMIKHFAIEYMHQH